MFILLSSVPKHPFIKSDKPSSILRALITDAMEIKLKKQEAQQREQDQDEEENSVRGGFGGRVFQLNANGARCKRECEMG